MEAGAEPARYVYCGPVWRRQEFGSDRPREYLQAGFEIFEAGDPAATDAEVLGLVVEALGDAPVDLVTGDLGLAFAVIDALDTSAARRMALRRHVWRPARFRALLDRYGEGHAAAAAGRAALARRRSRGAGARARHRRRRRRRPAHARGRRRPRHRAGGRGAHRRRSTPARWRGSRRCSASPAPPPTPSAELRGLARGLAPLGAAVDRLDRAARRAGRARHRAGDAALRGELRPHHARILRRLRLRRAAARPARPAADRQRRALRRADPRPRPRPRHPGGRRHAPARGAGGADRGRGMLRLGVPSKGRLQDETIAWFAARGIRIARAGQGREYRGTVEGIDGVELVLLSAGEIPGELAVGRARSSGSPGRTSCASRSRAGQERLAELAPMGFGFADLVVAVPAFWIDVVEMGDLDAAAAAVPRPPRPPPAGRDQVPPPGPRVLPAPRRRQLPARRQPGRDRGHGQEPAPPRRSPTSPPPARRCATTTCACSTTA